MHGGAPSALSWSATDASGGCQGLRVGQETFYGCSQAAYGSAVQ